jgi:hypothetical protein
VIPNHGALFELYAACGVVLGVVLLLLSRRAASAGARSRASCSVGDVIDAYDDTCDVYDDAYDDAREDALLFYVLGAIYLLAGASTAGGVVCFCGFTAARVVHAVCDRGADVATVAPLRALAVAAGQLFLFALVLAIGAALCAS